MELLLQKGRGFQREWKKRCDSNFSPGQKKEICNWVVGFVQTGLTGFKIPIDLYSDHQKPGTNKFQVGIGAVYNEESNPSVLFGPEFFWDLANIAKPKDSF